MRVRFLQVVLATGVTATLAGCGWIRGRSDFERDPFVMNHLTKEDGIAWDERQRRDDRVASTSRKSDPSRMERHLADTRVPEARHARDYHWVVGHLEHRSGPASPWIVVYGPSDADRFGGSLPLEKSPQLGLVREGDRVLLEGEVIDAEEEPRYRVRSVARIDSN